MVKLRKDGQPDGRSLRFQKKKEENTMAMKPEQETEPAPSETFSKTRSGPVPDVLSPPSPPVAAESSGAGDSSPSAAEPVVVDQIQAKRRMYRELAKTQKLRTVDDFHHISEEDKGIIPSDLPKELHGRKLYYCLWNEKMIDNEPFAQQALQQGIVAFATPELFGDEGKSIRWDGGLRKHNGCFVLVGYADTMEKFKESRRVSVKQNLSAMGEKPEPGISASLESKHTTLEEIAKNL